MKKAIPEIIEFRSSLDFRRKSWLLGDHSFQTGLYKNADNINYSISWSNNLRFKLNDDLGEILIEADTWSIPFELKLEPDYFSNTNSDDKLALEIQKFLSHLIDCIEHIYLEIDVIKFRLDGRPILIKTDDRVGWRRLKYSEMKIDLAEIFEEYALLQDTDHHDAMCLEAARQEPREVSWQFLIDAVASFDAGHYRGAVIYACCAVEIEVAPVVRDWLSESSYTQPTSLIDNAIMNLSNPIKFELFFGCGKGKTIDILQKKYRVRLLEQLKWLNALRNRVVHSGTDVTPDDARRSIRIAGLILRIIWVRKRQHYFEDYGIPDVFSDFSTKIQKTSL